MSKVAEPTPQVNALPHGAIRSATVDGVTLYQTRRGQWFVRTDDVRAKVTELEAREKPTSARFLSGMTGTVGFTRLTRVDLDELATWRDSLIRAVKRLDRPTRNANRAAKRQARRDAALRDPNTIRVKLRSAS